MRKKVRVLSFVLVLMMIINMTLNAAPTVVLAADLDVDLSFEGGDSEFVNYEPTARRATKFVLTDDASISQVQVKITSCTGDRDLIVSIYGSTSDNTKPDDRRCYQSVTVANADVKAALQNEAGVVTADFTGLELFAGHYWVVLNTSQDGEEKNTIGWARLTDTGDANQYTAACGTQPVEEAAGGWGSYTPHRYWLKVAAQSATLIPELEAYYTGDGGSTEVNFNVKVHSGATEEEALNALPVKCYAKLNSGVYYPVELTWTITGIYDGNDESVNSYVGKVSADSCPISLADVQGSVTIEKNAFIDYFDGSGADAKTVAFEAEVPSKTTEEDALAALPTTVYEKYTNGTSNEVQIAWAFDEVYDGTDGAENRAIGTVTSQDGQKPYAETVEGTVSISMLEGYYVDETCLIPLDYETEVKWTGDAETDEAAAIAVLPTTGYARYSNGSVFEVSIVWTLKGAFDGTQFAVNEYIGAVSSTSTGWQDYSASLNGKVTLQGAMYTDAEDYSFSAEDENMSEKVDFGGTGRRAQMFALDYKSYIGKVDIMISSYTGTKDVVVKLKPADENNNPDDSRELGAVTIPSATLAENIGKPISVDFGGIEVEPGKYYIELTTSPSEAPGDQIVWATINGDNSPADENAYRAWNGSQGSGWSNASDGSCHYLRVEYARDYVPKDMIIDYTWENMESGQSEAVNYYQQGGGRGTVVRWREDAKLEGVDFFVSKSGTDDMELRIVEADAGSDRLTNIKILVSVEVANADIADDYGETHVELPETVELEGGKTYAFLLVPKGNTASTYHVPLYTDTTMLKVYCGGNGAAWSTGGGLHPFRLYVETDAAVERPAESIKEEVINPDDPNENLLTAEDPIPDDQVDDDINGDKDYFRTDATIDYTFTPSAWEDIDYNSGARRGQIIEITEDVTVSSLDILVRLTGDMYNTERGPLNITLYDASDWNPTDRIEPEKYWFTYTIPGSVENYPENGYQNGIETRVTLDEPVFLPAGTYALVFRPQAGSYGQFQIPNDAGAVGSYKMWSGGQTGSFDTAAGKHWVRLNATTKIEKGQPSYARKLSVDLTEPLYYLKVGEPLGPTINVYDQYGQPLALADADFRVQSSDENVAVVEATNGVITGVNPGTVTISYMAGQNLRYTVNVQVYDSKANKISGAPVIAVQEGTAEATDYTVIDDWKFDLGNVGITYEIADTGIATVDNTGVVTGISKGETVMTVKYNDLEKYVNVSVYTEEDNLVVPTDGMSITEDVVFKPGEYVLPNGISIDAEGITVNGNGAIIKGSDNPVLNGAGNGYENGGTGVTLNGHDNVTIKNLTAKNYNLGLRVNDSNGLSIENNDFSDNFTNPDYGWGDGNRYGGILLENVSGSVIKNNNATNVWNALMLVFSDNNEVFYNDFGICSNVNLYVWGSSYNEIYDNIFNWGIRCDPGETHARDSTSSLFEENSCYNYVARNDFSHGGDGIFIRPLNTSPPMGNYFEENDVSWANNNGIESWAPGNNYVNNICNYSSYGIWLGGNDFCNLIGNEVKYNGGVGGGKENAPEGFGNAGIALANGVSSHFTAIGNDASENNGPGLAIRYVNAYQDAYHWIISGNTLANNKNYGGRQTGVGVYTDGAQYVDIIGNNITGNDQGQVQVADGSTSVISTGANDAASSYDIQTLPDISVEIGPVLSDYYHADEHWDDIPQQIKDADWGITDIRYVTVEAGTEVTFDASSSVRANQYTWQFETTTAKVFDVKTGEIVTYTFENPGTYRAGVTALNTAEEQGSLKGFVITVIPAGDEIGTDDSAEEWEAAVGTGTNPSVNLSETVYNVEGDKAIKVTAVGQNYGLTYPADKNLDWSDLDLTETNTLSMAFKVFIGNGNNTAGQESPILTLYKDENNYIRFTPNKPYMRPINMPTSEARYAYQYVEFKLDGNYTNDYFTGQVVGDITPNEVKYLTITAGPTTADTRSSITIDALKLVGLTSETFVTTFIVDDVEYAKVETKVGEAIAMPQEPVKTGYTFDGWFTEKTGGTQVTVFTGTQTVYAHWTENGEPGTPDGYTVVFDANGGTVNPATIKTDAEGKLTVLPTPTRNNYTFDGWFTHAEGGIQITIDTVFSANVTVYAHWTYSGGDIKDTYYTIAATAGQGGTISPSGVVSIREGGANTFTIKPDEGYRVADVKVDGNSVGPVESYTFKDVDKNHTIEASFEKAEGVAAGQDNSTAKTGDSFKILNWTLIAVTAVCVFLMMVYFGIRKSQKGHTDKQ